MDTWVGYPVWDVFVFYPGKSCFGLGHGGPKSVWDRGSVVTTGDYGPPVDVYVKGPDGSRSGQECLGDRSNRGRRSV